ncbi:hypothetical protein SNN62_002822 [Cronobacter sakazakii]|nr:hypothetical protein [Cronobacter sakazakii]
MKLIDLLVQELPKRGGWPEGFQVICSHGNGHIYAHSHSGKVSGRHLNIYGCQGQSVTLEQYEAALAAAQQSVWDGEGLPPAGCECEGRFILGGKWFFFRCVAVDCGIAFGWAGKDAVTLDKGSYEFRPIRSEADKRRDEAIAALVDFKIGYHSYPKAAEEYLREVTALYDAILRGEIPHIRIDHAA